MEITKLLDEVNKDAILTAHHLDLYNQLSKIINDKEQLKKADNTILRWMQDAFTADLVICIGRICDNHPKTISLVRFLFELKKKTNNHYLSRERHIKLYKPHPIVSFGDLSFDKLAGEGQQSFSTNLISADIAKITNEEPIKKILKYRNQYVAHNDKIKDEAPTYDELFQAFNQIESMIKKYNLLLRASLYNKLAPVVQGYWEEVFTIPWINNEKLLALKPPIPPSQ